MSYLMLYHIPWYTILCILHFGRSLLCYEAVYGGSTYIDTRCRIAGSMLLKTLCVSPAHWISIPSVVQTVRLLDERNVPSLGMREGRRLLGSIAKSGWIVRSAECMLSPST
nr:hypothetical protein CFP56_09690 [Quercus suber]